MTSSAPLSPAQAALLGPRLDLFLRNWDFAARLRFDPVELPHRYRDPRDIEVSALLSASLAYGRADLFKPKVEALLGAMGPSPADFVRSLDISGARSLLRGFVYRFNVGTDLAVLLLGIGRALREKGSLEALFAEGLTASGTLCGALVAFTSELRTMPMAALRKAMGAERGLQHLLPQPASGGASKRLNLFLRWMVRGPDAIDFGIWKQVSPARLVIPLDTHIHRIARHLGLTRRNDVSWRTAEEITASLRQMDPSDPIRYDFALCHYGMSGICPVQPVADNCVQCALLGSCRVGPRSVSRGKGRRSA